MVEILYGLLALYITVSGKSSPTLASVYIRSAVGSKRDNKFKNQQEPIFCWLNLHKPPVERNKLALAPGPLGGEAKSKIFLEIKETSSFIFSKRNPL